MAILFSQVNIADAADVNPSGTNTSQVTLSDDANKSSPMSHKQIRSAEYPASHALTVASIK